MPVSSTGGFHWSGDSSHSISNQRIVDSSSGSVHASLAEWTHFETNLNSIHNSENDAHNILKELLKDEPGIEAADSGAHALLKQILNDKPGT